MRSAKVIPISPDRLVRTARTDAEVIDRFRRWWPTASRSVQDQIRALVAEQEATKHDTQALEVLEFLNAKRPGKRGFRPCAANLRLIRARLADGISIDDLRSIVAMKARAVEVGQFDSLYLRPATLFNSLRCEQYLGELVDG